MTHFGVITFFVPEFADDDIPPASDSNLLARRLPRDTTVTASNGDHNNVDVLVYVYLMSRRKQANPKPAKREPAEQSSSLAANPELPVYLKKFGAESLVLAKEVLKAGTVLGTYKGTTVKEGEEEEGDTFIKVNRSDGGSPLHVMLEDDGHWLKLMRTATIPTDANICLRFSGKDIICTVTKDVNKEVELKVTCRIADPCHEKQCTVPEKAHRKSPGASRVKEVELEVQETVPEDCTSPKAMLVDCIPNSVCSYSDTVACASSLNCREVSEEERSPKSDTAESDIDMDEFKEEAVSSSTARESPSSDREMRIKSESDTNQNSKDFESRRTKNSEDSVIKHSPEYEYPNAESYLYERQNRSRHSPNSRNVTTPTNPKSFCDACKIQFLSVNTYQVHKKFYCKSRHENEDTIPMSVLESTSGGLSTAFKPSADTVILRSGVNGGVPPSVIQPQAIYAAISTNPLILLPCTLVPGQGLVPQNGIIPTGTPGIVLQSGIACPTIVEKPQVPKPVEVNCPTPTRKTSHPASINSSDEPNDQTLLSSSKIAMLKRKISEGEVLNIKKKYTGIESTVAPQEKTFYETKEVEIDPNSPLDLTVKTKKTNESNARNSPHGRRNSVISTGHPSSPGYRACASGSPPGPSVISSSHSAPSPTNSYSNDSSCYASQVPVVVHRVPPPVERISPLPPVLQSAVVDKTIPPPGMLPPKLMKQGNNICEECHIVFIKYDNLVTHKKHYCAYRRRQLSAMAAAVAAAAAASSQEQSSDDNNSNHSGINEGTSNFPADDPGNASLRKLEYSMDHYRAIIAKPPQPAYCCDACGVKFSTSDTLVAHQTYYCMKKPDSAMAKASSKKGDESNSIDSPFSGPEEWKCNYCEASCSSYETMRRHLLTHSEPRGYRCLLCGYKGNTLRGMRTHACEHMSEETTSVEEFMSTTVISEGGGLPIIPRTLECSDSDSDAQKELPTYRQRERTSSNNSDTVKERTNVKHERAVHSDSEEQSHSPRCSDNGLKDLSSKATGSVKTESTGDSNSNHSGNQEAVNPLAFCDVVIKTENDHTGSDEDSDKADVKLERDSDSSEKSPVTSHPHSVIRIAEKREEVPHASSRRKSKPLTRSSSDPKCCKTCGVSFQHLSNFLTHKKFYCDSRTSLSNCLPETATVQ